MARESLFRVARVNDLGSRLDSGNQGSEPVVPGLGGQLQPRQFRRRSQADDARDVLGPAPPAVFLNTAMNLGNQAQLIPKIEGPDAFRAPSAGPDRLSRSTPSSFTSSGTVPPWPPRRCEKALPAPANRGQFRRCWIVPISLLPCMMETSTVSGVMPCQTLRVHQAMFVHRQEGHFGVKKFFQKPGGIEHRMVFDGRDDQVSALLPAGQNHPFYRQIIGLRPGRSEDNVFLPEPR